MKYILFILSLLVFSFAHAVETQVKGDVDFQSGAGVPSHAASKASLYLDHSNGKLYCNSDGGTTWAKLDEAPSANSLQDLRSRFPVELAFSQAYNHFTEVVDAAGSVQDSIHRMNVRTTGANGEASATWNTVNGRPFWMQPGVAQDILDYDKEFAFYVPMAVAQAATGGEIWCYLGRQEVDTVTLAPDDKLIGFEVRNLALFGIVHDGTTENAVDLSTTVTEDTLWYMVVHNDGVDTVTWYYSTDAVTFNSVGSTTTNTPDLLSTVQHFTWSVMAKNTTSGDQEGSVVDVRIFTK